MEAGRGMSQPEECSNKRIASLFEKPSSKSLTLPLQELATLFSCPLTSNHEPMEQATVAPSSGQTVHVEVCQAALSTLRFSQVRELVKRHYGDHRGAMLRDGVEKVFTDSVLSEHITSITVSDANEVRD